MARGCIRSSFRLIAMQTKSLQRWRSGSWAYALLVTPLLFGMQGCALWEIGAEKDVVKNGLRFKKFREFDDGSKLGTLFEDTVIDGWPVAGDFVVFHSDWRLDELQLSRDYERNGVFMPKGTWVFPNAAGNPGVCMFPRDIEMQGYLVRGSRAGKKGFMTYFYNSGKLRLFWSRDPVVVDGVTCKDTILQGILLHENGRLRSCTLEKQTIIGTTTFGKGARISLDEAGNVLTPPS